MLRCLLCDDESWYLREVQDTVSRLFLQEKLPIELCAFSDMREFMEEYEKDSIPFDLAVLDFEMPYFNGAQIAKTLCHVNPACLVMILTSHVEMAVDLYEAQIYRFLPKEEMVERLEKYIPQACRALRQLEGEAIVLREGTEPVKIRFQSIICVRKEKKLKFSLIYLGNREEPVRVRVPLAELMKKLPENQFYLPERSTLVNLAFVERIEDRSLFLRGGLQVDISHGKETAAKNRIAQFWGERI